MKRSVVPGTVQRTILANGTTQIPLPTGIYIVTLNGGTGYKVIIE
ncbi:MAG: DUF6383 domain-containing protein [Tannerella sp.]|nr:DUF6383 domain-containing protein [Tannerella sp.]